MLIDRHNYEEYFILYMDNELDAEGRRAVEAFVALHPDLKEELDLLQQYKLVPDEDIRFDGKEELLKVNGETPLSLTNAEEWMVLAMDGELNPQKQAELQQFIALHPALQKTQQQLAACRLEADNTVVFPDKQSLCRKEEKVRPLISAWLRVAAVLLLVLGGTGTFILLNNKKGTVNDGPGLASKNTPATNPVHTAEKTVVPVEQKNETAPGITRVAPEEKLATINNPAQASVNNPAKQSTVKGSTDRKQQLPEIKQGAQPEERAIADNKVNEKGSNNLPVPDQNPNVNPSIKRTNDAIARTGIPDEIKSTTTTPLTSAIVTTGNPSPSLPTDAPLEESGKKNKLRGFFRKVTRTFERRTNIEATDGNDRLLVAGLSIKMK